MNFVRKNSVPLFFVALCGTGAYYSGLGASFLLNEIITRLARNSFLVISLIIPVLAGMGLNFGIVLGAMAAQLAYILVVNLELSGFVGVLATCVLSIPLSVIFGWLTGILFNKAKGKEMITGIILGFFANGLYQLVCLTFVGWIIPVRLASMLLPDKSGAGPGIGLVNTIDLRSMQYSIDNLWKIRITMPDIRNFCAWMGWDVTIPPSIPITIPVGTFLIIGLLCAGMYFLFRTKLGQDFRAVGQDRTIAEVSGIAVDRVRVAAIVFSTVLAGLGQIVFLQNMGNLQTYGSHVQVGTFAVASLLIGGASVARATVGQALLGTLLFYTLFVVSPQAGKNLMGNVQVGEFFRVFISYGVIGVALALHAWRRIRDRNAGDE
jgi:simple sugar transport system permease protein